MKPGKQNKSRYTQSGSLPIILRCISVIGLKEPHATRTMFFLSGLGGESLLLSMLTGSGEFTKQRRLTVLLRSEEKNVRETNN
jgi:hypothetical protein